jgi:hypothetical protein
LPWERLSELARRERELVDGERWDELIELQAERQQLLDCLPAEPPAEAEEALEESLLQARRTQQALQAALDQVESALGAVRRGRRAVSAYGLGGDSGLEHRA